MNYPEIPDSWNDGEREKMEMRFAYDSDQMDALVNGHKVKFLVILPNPFSVIFYNDSMS